MKFELKTENDNFTKSIYSVFLTIAISFFIIIIFSIALEIRTISSHYEINFLCRLITVEKKSSQKKLRGSSTATAILNGESIEFTIKKNESILEAGLAAGHDIQFSCQGGVCGVCKCMVGEGKVEMENNIALSDDEVDSGAVLSCQAKVLSPTIKITFDS